MNDDSKKPTGDDEPGEGDEKTTAEEADADDDAASVLFFGDHLENLVHGERVSEATITNEAEEVERTPMDSPSALFFGESLEDAAEREAREEAEDRARAAEGFEDEESGGADDDEY